MKNDSNKYHASSRKHGRLGRNYGVKDDKGNVAGSDEEIKAITNNFRMLAPQDAKTNIKY